MAKYAATTDVGADRSRAEIERTLQRYGGREFMYGWDETKALVGFVIHDRQVRFVLPLPDRADPEFKDHDRAAAHRQRRERRVRSSGPAALARTGTGSEIEARGRRDGHCLVRE